jgi:hypothetical protein
MKQFFKKYWAVLVAFALMSGSVFAGTNDLVNYDAGSGALTFNPGAFIAPLINTMVATVTAAIPLALLGWGIVVLFRGLGLVGKRK